MADFTVSEADVRQTITGFAAEQTEVSVVLALDTSGSMAGTLARIKTQAKEFLALLPANWPTTVLAFDDSVFTVVQPRTSPEQRAQAIDRLTARGGTALYGAILSSLHAIEAVVGRKAIILFTDGEDRSSVVGVDEIRKAVEQSDSVLYFVAAGEAAKFGPTRDLLESISETSGGRVLDGRDSHAVNDAFRQISEEMRNQYLLTYVPVNLARPGTWRPLLVKASCRDCRIRARKGYRVADR
jgi:VWFA-related protein